MKNKKIIVFGFWLLVVSLLLGCRSNTARKEWGNMYGFEKEEVFNIEIKDYGFPYIRSKINNIEINMMFDTGNMNGISVSSEISKRLKLTKIGEIIHMDSAGNIRGSFNVFDSEKIFVFGREIKGEKIYESFSNDLDGIIPPSLLLKNRFTIDYNNKFIGVSKNSYPDTDINKEIFSLIPNKKYPGMPVVEGVVNGQKVLIQLDTGKSRTCVDESLIKKLNLPLNDRGYEINNIKLGSFNFSITNAKKTSFKGISEGYPQPIMLGIGSDIISKIVFTVDYPNEKVIISE